MAKTTEAVLDHYGLCYGCQENHQKPGSKFCEPCETEDLLLSQAIREVRAGTANPTVREVQERSLRTIYGIIGHGATEMSPTCDHCGRKSQGRYCSPSCRAATFSGRA